MKDKTISYFKGVWSELQKVNWPSRKTVVNHSIIVIISAVVAILIIMALDFGLSNLVEYLVDYRN